jgi:hypothetical protein
MHIIITNAGAGRCTECLTTGLGPGSTTRVHTRQGLVHAMPRMLLTAPYAFAVTL